MPANATIATNDSDFTSILIQDEIFFGMARENLKTGLNYGQTKQIEDSVRDDDNETNPWPIINQ